MDWTLPEPSVEKVSHTTWPKCEGTVSPRRAGPPHWRWDEHALDQGPVIIPSTYRPPSLESTISSNLQWNGGQTFLSDGVKSPRHRTAFSCLVKSYPPSLRLPPRPPPPPPTPEWCWMEENILGRQVTPSSAGPTIPL